MKRKQFCRRRSFGPQTFTVYSHNPRGRERTCGLFNNMIKSAGTTSRGVVFIFVLFFKVETKQLLGSFRLTSARYALCECVIGGLVVWIPGCLSVPITIPPALFITKIQA